MNRIILIFLILALGCGLHGAEKKRFVLYAMLTADTGVRLTDGARWNMDKGDTFPVVMYKDQQTKIVLQLAGATFTTETANVKVVEEKDLTPEQVATYRTNVQRYLDGKAEKWKAEQGK